MCIYVYIICKYNNNGGAALALAAASGAIGPPTSGMCLHKTV